MIPAWAPIDFEFDQVQIKNELLQDQILNKSIIATTSYNEFNHSIWDADGDKFPEEIFKKQKLIHHYKDIENSSDRILQDGEYNTFKMLNLTHYPSIVETQQNAWQGSIRDDTRSPFWIKYQKPWDWRNDLNLPLTKAVIDRLPLEYLLTVRCILQQAPAIGVVHKDNGTKGNQEFYNAGFGSITLNICSGGANLWFLNTKDQKKYMIDEANYKCWHFDDSNLHCTTEVTDLRIQLRIFGKLNQPYINFLIKEKMII